MKTIHYIVSEFQGKYIVGYKYHNGYRFIHHYVTSVYRGKYMFSLDYTHAKTYSYETAKKHVHMLHNMKIGENELC